MYLPELFEFLETTMQITPSLIKTSQQKMIRCISSGGSTSQKQPWTTEKGQNYNLLQCKELSGLVYTFAVVKKEVTSL